MNDPMFDTDLQAVMGGRYTDETVPKAPAHKKGPTTAVDAPWAPVKPTFMDRLRSCVKTTIPLAVASTVIFWWQVSGQLVEDAAHPALWALAILLGLSLGANLKGEK